MQINYLSYNTSLSPIIRGLTEPFKSVIGFICLKLINESEGEAWTETTVETLRYVPQPGKTIN